MSRGIGDCCEEYCIHPEVIKERSQQALEPEAYEDLAGIFKTLGDPTRVRIIHQLSIGELCVCDLADILAMSQSAVSHQLRLLRNLRLVRHRKEGKMVFYSLDDDHILSLFRQGLDHVRHR
ncbi:MAG: metalloregulator ArsR/SmtB family transcription factor [Heliobacteriaceae bacterium]|nr:metalloregulator ArsR/SmtB family transcription factor [Heliobacteriaceae bacterium]